MSDSWTSTDSLDLPLFIFMAEIRDQRLCHCLPEARDNDTIADDISLQLASLTPCATVWLVTSHISSAQRFLGSPPNLLFSSSMKNCCTEVFDLTVGHCSFCCWINWHRSSPFIDCFQTWFVISPTFPKHHAIFWHFKYCNSLHICFCWLSRLRLHACCRPFQCFCDPVLYVSY